MIYVISASGPCRPPNIPDQVTCKIGYTSSASSVSRLRSLQTGNANQLVLVKEIEGELDQEARLHNHFRRFRNTGEWFSLPGHAIRVLRWKKITTAEHWLNETKSTVLSSALGVRRAERQQPTIDALESRLRRLERKAQITDAERDLIAEQARAEVRREIAEALCIHLPAYSDLFMEHPEPRRRWELVNEMARRMGAPRP